MSTQTTSDRIWRVTARQGGFAAAVVLLLTGLFFVWRASSLSFGDGSGVPGPAFFPFCLGIGLSVVAAAILVETARTPDNPATPPIELGHRDVIVVFAALVGVALGFEALGAYLTLALLMAGLLLVVARVSWPVALLAAAVTVVVIWVVFKWALGVQLPSGPF